MTDPLREMDEISRLLGVRPSELRQYARRQSGEGGWQGFIRGLLDTLTGGRSGRSAQTRRNQDSLFEQIANAVLGGGRGGRGTRTPPGTSAPTPSPGGNGPVPPPPPGGFSTRALPTPQPPGGGPGVHRSLRSTQAAPPLPGESDLPFGEEILVTNSSNVFSFSYKRMPGVATGNLYVTYHGHQINKHATSRGTVAAKGMPREQLVGTLGKTLTGARGGRGSMYCYFDVPPNVFTRMKAASSKGKFVWDALRIRGTIYGHQYRYQLVQGQVTPGVGVYIPRKATRKGFRTRSVADLGTGVRGFQTSTLPEQTFSTRSNGGRRRR